MTSTLSRWLATRTPDDLAAILGRRPEALAARDLGEVASRLQSPYALIAVLRDLPQPCLEILETLLVFGADGLSREKLAGILNVAPEDGTFDAALQVCELWAMAWSHQDRWHVPGALRTVLAAPLGLGPTVAELLTPRTVDDLRSRGAAVGIAVPARKTEIIDRLAEFFDDAHNVRRLYHAAPSAQRELLMEAAWHGPVLRYDGTYLYTGRPDPAISWLLTHGLAISDWQQIVVPREVAIALRGDDWHPRLTPRPDFSKLIDVPAGAADRDAAAAAAAAVDQIAAALEVCGAAPLAVLRSGGIGVREVRRLAKAIRQDEASTRLWLAVAHAAGLLGVDDEEVAPAAPTPRRGRARIEPLAPPSLVVMPTRAYDEWLGAPPGARLATIVRAWLTMAGCPTLATRPDGVARALFVEDPADADGTDLRHDVLGVAAEIPAGQGVHDLAEVTAMAAWRQPLIALDLGDVDSAVAASWAEACALGIIGHGTLSSLGRALLADAAGGGTSDATAAGTINTADTAGTTDTADTADADIYAIAARLMPASTAQAIFQADLTIVVPGSCGPELGALLDAVADRESRGAATTWRVSTTTVRRSLDGGNPADEVIARLRAVAVGGTLPQPLEYLITDVARRHGQLRVREVGCVLRADDPALLAEIAAAKALGHLRLSLIAPTVLASAAGAATTLAALRSAGYAPVGESDDGIAVVERSPRRRAPTVPPQVRRIRHVPAVDPHALATTLLATAQAPRDAPAPARKTAATGTAGAPTRTLAVLPGGNASGPAAAPNPAAPNPANPNPANLAPPTVSATVARYAKRLTRDELFLLSEAIEEGRPVSIGYTSGEGEHTRRVIDPIELEDGILVAWCRLRDGERNFVLGRVDSVAPAF